MDERTERKLLERYAAESVSAARCEIFVQKAEREGRKDLALVFKTLATAGEAQCRRLMMLLRGKVGDTEANLKEMKQYKERLCSTELPEAVREALEGGDELVASALSQFLKAGRGHLNLFGRAGEEPPSAFWVCQVCGYVVADEAPEQCPVCGAVQQKFVSVT